MIKNLAKTKIIHFSSKIVGKLGQAYHKILRLMLLSTPSGNERHNSGAVTIISSIFESAAYKKKGHPKAASFSFTGY
jgi:hypothetical protein